MLDHSALLLKAFWLPYALHPSLTRRGICSSLHIPYTYTATARVVRLALVQVCHPAYSLLWRSFHDVSGLGRLSELVTEHCMVLEDWAGLTCMQHVPPGH